MRQPKAVWTRSDLIAGLGLLLGAISIACSLYFSWRNDQKIEEANSIAREANRLVVEQSSPNAQVSLDFPFTTVWLLPCHDEVGSEPYHIAAYTRIFPTISNLGGRTLSLLSIEIDGTIYDTSPNVHEQYGLVALPLNLGAGESRKPTISGFTTLARFASETEAKAFSAGPNRLNWVFRFNDGNEIVLATEGPTFAEYQEFPQPLPSCSSVETESRNK